MNFLPLWTATVWPTNSGEIVERRDQVFSTFFCRVRFSSSIRSSSVGSMYGPFFSERPISDSYFVRRVTMALSDGLAPRRVLYPLVGLPHGVIGWLPLPLPSPPPMGWSTGFITVPRTVGLKPFQRTRPALPTDTFSWSRLPTWPTVAMHSSLTWRTSPEGSLRLAWSPSLARSWARVPALRQSCPPLPGCSSTLCTSVPRGMFLMGRALPDRMSAWGPD